MNYYRVSADTLPQLYRARKKNLCLNIKDSVLKIERLLILKFVLLEVESYISSVILIVNVMGGWRKVWQKPGEIKFSFWHIETRHDTWNHMKLASSCENHIITHFHLQLAFFYVLKKLLTCENKITSYGLWILRDMRITLIHNLLFSPHVEKSFQFLSILHLKSGCEEKTDIYSNSRLDQVFSLISKPSKLIREITCSTLQFNYPQLWFQSKWEIIGRYLCSNW